MLPETQRAISEAIALSGIGKASAILGDRVDTRRAADGLPIAARRADLLDWCAKHRPDAFNYRDTPDSEVA